MKETVKENRLANISDNSVTSSNLISYYKSNFAPTRTKNIYYTVCVNCGANLDPGEKCDCYILKKGNDI